MDMPFEIIHRIRYFPLLAVLACSLQGATWRRQWRTSSMESWNQSLPLCSALLLWVLRFRRTRRQAMLFGGRRFDIPTHGTSGWRGRGNPNLASATKRGGTQGTLGCPSSDAISRYVRRDLVCQGFQYRQQTLVNLALSGEMLPTAQKHGSRNVCDTLHRAGRWVLVGSRPRCTPESCAKGAFVSGFLDHLTFRQSCLHAL